MHDQWGFIQSVFAHVVASMSGVASFVFSLIERIRKKKLSSRIFFAVGILCLIIAFYQAWEDEHIKVVQLQKQLEEPNVTFDFDNTPTYVIPPGDRMEE